MASSISNEALRTPDRNGFKPLHITAWEGNLKKLPPLFWTIENILWESDLPSPDAVLGGNDTSRYCIAHMACQPSGATWCFTGLSIASR
jgi:hypothetical protein